MVKRKKWTFFLLFFSLSLDREKTSFTPPLSLSLLSRFLPFAVKTSNAKRDKERQRVEAAFSSSSGLSRHRKKFNSPSRFCVSCFFLRIALGLFRKWLASGMKKKGAVDTSRYFADEKKEVLEKKKRKHRGESIYPPPPPPPPPPRSSAFLLWSSARYSPIPALSASNSRRTWLRSRSHTAAKSPATAAARTPTHAAATAAAPNDAEAPLNWCTAASTAGAQASRWPAGSETWDSAWFSLSSFSVESEK